MKKHLFTLLVSLAAMAVTETAVAQCTWQAAGTGTVSTAASNSYADIVYSGTPYVIYTDVSTSNTATVKKLSSGSWVAVGSGTLSTNAAYNRIQADGSGTIYAIYQDGNAGKKAVVKSFNGTSWAAVGTGTVSADTASYTDIALDNSGTPYVAFADKVSGKKVVVKKYSGGSWTQVGAAVSTGTASYISIAIDAANMPYVAYQDASTGKAMASKYNGSAWTSLGAVSTTTATYISLVFNRMTGEPWVSYVASSTYYGNVSRYTGGAWTAVGAAFYGPYQCMDMAIDSAGKPYVSYYDLTPYKASVMTYTGTWAYAGNSAISTSGPSSTAMAISPRGLPYVAYSNGPVVCQQLSSPSGNQPNTPNVTACDGATATLSVPYNANTVSYQWQKSPTGVNPFTNLANAPYSGTSTGTLSINTAGLSSGYYRCVTSDGCINEIYYRGLLTVNPRPAVAASSTTLCLGAAKTLTASGALTYSWTSGATTASVSVSPTVTTTYSVFGTDANGCSDTAVSHVYVNASKTLSGTASSTAGAVSGNMILYKYSPALGQWDSTAFTPFSSIFSFGTVDSSLYVVKAVPTATNMQITYGTNAISWQSATVITHGCTSGSTQHVQILPYTSVPAGPGMLGGHISQASGYGHKAAGIQSPGNPIPGIVVKGGKNPGAAIFGQTVTDTSGNYSFNNLPLNTGLDDYFILVDIPGLDTNKTYHKVLTTTNNSYTTLDFTVDSIYVNPVDVATSVNELNKADYLVKLFPNPAQSLFTIQYSLLQQAGVGIDLYDVVGRHVKRIGQAVTQAPGDYAIQVTTDELNPGMYFVKLLIDGHEATIKVFINR